MKWGLSLSLLFVFGLLTGNVDADEKKDGCNIQLQGEIDNNTPSRLASLYNALNNKKPEQCSTIALQLDSTGGNVEAAISAGEFVRQKKMVAIVPADSSCASSCVLVLLGGVYRVAAGNIGLHRPFTDELSMSESLAKGKYEKANRLIRQYFNRMNIPEALLDIMNAVPPGKIKWLDGIADDEQLKELHISGEDPVYQDQIDSLHAKRLGISKKEYYSREQKVEAICRMPTSHSDKASIRQYFKCSEDIMNGKR